MLVNKGFSVSEALKYLKISRSTYYYKPRKYTRRTKDEKTLREIEELKRKHPYWGYRRICAMLRKACRTIQKKIKPNRHREILGIDMTKIFTRDAGWVYYVAVIDWYTREIPGSEISLRCRTEEWLRALDKVLNKGYPKGVRGKEVKLVSDNGSQPTSTKFLKECNMLGIKQIFTSYNNPKGNANTERYFRTYKEEVAWVMDNPGYEELVEKTKLFERFYNEEYPHSALGRKSPKEVFEETLSLHKIA